MSNYHQNLNKNNKISEDKVQNNDDEDEKIHYYPSYILHHIELY